MGDIQVWRVNISETGVELCGVDIAASSRSLNEVTKALPGGAYTTFRTYKGRKVLRLKDQIHRLEETAKIVGCPVQVDENALRAALRLTVCEFGGQGELRFRVIIDLDQQPGTIYIAVEDLVTPSAEDYAHGVRVVTCNLQRDKPKAKLTRFIALADKVRQELNSDVHEALIVDDEGYILEGLSSNFFGIVFGKLRTAKGVVLSGITRALVLEEAVKGGIEVSYDPVHLDEIPFLDGAFITSASRGVLPIHSINEQVIADGKPDPVTIRLSQRYEQRICEEVEDI